MSKDESVRVLYMEDDVALARLLQRRLKRTGYSVDLAHDGKEGLETYAAGAYDVLIVDQQMPAHTGLEVIRILASQGPLPPTIMITGAGDERTAVEAMKLGARDYVVKDVAGGYMDLLPSVVDQVLERCRLEEEKRRAEQQLRRYAAELEQRTEEARQLAHAISQDLRAPLANLKGFVAELSSTLEMIGSALSPLLEEGQQPEAATAMQEEVPQALALIESAVTCMDDLIGAVVRWSSLGHREIKPEPVDMNALVQDTLGVLAHQIQAGQVEVKVGELPQVVADRDAMEEIVGNLLGNAVVYLVLGRPGEIEITAESGEEQTTFHIRDNGQGMAEEDIERVFVPFRRADRPDAPVEGMGLAHVQALVRRHGGRIWCESEPGVGTTFSFAISNRPAEGGEGV